MAAGARWTLPAAKGQGTRRTLYFFKGATATVAGQQVHGPVAIEVRGDAPIELVNGETEGEFLLLQGKPIGEPVVQYGPFVMNTQAEIMQAMQDYRRTQFGGWPWKDQAPVHARETPRFARHPDGREEKPAAA
jgi:redox-sensitive bicupin YhaK (pirin superfamily)